MSETHRISAHPSPADSSGVSIPSRRKDLLKKAGVGAVTVALAASMVPLSACSSTENNDNSTESASISSESTQANTSGSGTASSQGTASSSNSSGTADSQQNGTPPDLPSGTAQDGSVGGGANTQNFDYSGNYSATKTADGKNKTIANTTIAATDTDANAALVENGGTLTLAKDTITKSGDDASNADNCNFYGVNSGVLAVGKKSKAIIEDSSITTISAGSNGIFSTDNATVFANNDTVTTASSDGNARGLDATYGGTIVANKMTISTAGAHSASVATDRGGGNISLANSTLSTKGSGSPLLYSTGDIEVDNVTGTASGSQIAGMEGLNSILISNSTLKSTNDAISGSDPQKNGIIIYQSTSGDAETAIGDAASFGAEDSTLSTTISDGSMFYLTNTTANVVLKNTTLDFDSSKVALLTAQGNDSNNWGSAGSNGATVNFTLDSENVSGAIDVDDISTANVYLLNGTTWTGSTSITENSASNKSTSKTPLSINVDSDSTWVVTDDSTVSNLNVATGGKIVDADGKTVTLKVDGTTVVQGDSDYTVTINGSYSTKVKTTDANTIDSASISRTAFDREIGTSTTFGTNDSDERGSSVEENIEFASTADSGSSSQSADNSSSSSSNSGNMTADQLLAWLKNLIFGNQGSQNGQSMPDDSPESGQAPGSSSSSTPAEKPGSDTPNVSDSSAA
ncbi:MAG: beta strand repeat-containing protein [Eggerthellaceae bacterium]|jgi:hypothetical protein